MNLVDALPLGRSHAMKKHELARILGWSTRAFEEAVEQARKSGVLALCSDSQVGYWQPLTLAELAANIDARRRRAINQLLTTKGERAFLRRERARRIEQGVLWDAA